MFNQNIQSDIIKKNLMLPLGAFMMALLVWIFVISNNEYSMKVDIPIEARNLNAQKAHKEEVPEHASIILKGKGRDLFKTYLFRDFINFKLVLDLEGIQKEYEFILNDYFDNYPQKVVLPNSYNLELIEVLFPTKIKISLDENLIKNIPVKHLIDVVLINGYTQVGEIKLIPTYLEVAGPKVELENIDYIHTYTDTVFDAKSRIKRKIKIKNIGPLIKFSQQEIDYEIDIQQISERIIVDIPVKIKNIPNNIRVFPSPQTVSLTVLGGVNRISSVSSNDIEVIVNFNDWDMDEIFYSPEIIIPNNIISWSDLSPRNIELGVARESK